MSHLPSDRRRAPYERRSFRPEAESRLARNPAAESHADVPVEKLLHELQVRQIELDMQNDELRRAHFALEESRDRYLDLFEYAPVGYFTLTTAGLIAEANFTGAALLGLDRNDVLLRPFAGYVAPEFVDRFHQHMSRFSHQDERQNYDMQIRREDGELRYVHVDAVRVKAENGSVTLRITLTDITENQRVEDALRETTEYLRNLIGHANGPIVVWDASCRIVKFNHAIEKLTGLTAHEAIGLSIERLFPAGEREAVMDKIKLTMKGECWESLDIPVLHTSGGVRAISWNSATLYQADGKTVQAVIAQGQDITERKQVEQDLRIAATAFEVQEGILVTDEHSIIIRVNKAFTRLTGFSAEEVIGQPASILNSGRHTANFYKTMWKVINRARYWQGEICNRRKNGEVFPALMTITAVVGAHGKTTHYVGSFLDITLQKQAEQVLLDTRKHLEKQVEKTVVELNQIKEEAVEVNTALKVMMKLRETESSDAKNLLILELKQEVMPFLQRLKNGSHDPRQIRLLSALEANLQRLISSYGCVNNMTSACRHLTPKEIQVASMVREGFPTKVIAATLSLSPETISIHRKNIRKKLGLDSKADNLRSYLISLGK